MRLALVNLLTEKLAKIPFQKARVKWTIQTIDYSKLPQDLIEEWKRWYKPCGSFRLLTPMLLGETVSFLVLFSAQKSLIAKLKIVESDG